MRPSAAIELGHLSILLFVIWAIVSRKDLALRLVGAKRSERHFPVTAACFDLEISSRSTRPFPRENVFRVSASGK